MFNMANPLLQQLQELTLKAKHKSSLKFVDQHDFRKLLYFDNISVLDSVDATLFCQKVPKISIFLLYGFVFCFSKSSSIIINDSIFNLLSFYRQTIE